MSGILLLGFYILLRGSDSTLLKWLQQAGAATHAAGGPQVFAVLLSYDSSAKHTRLKRREELGPASSAKQYPRRRAVWSQLGVIPDA